MKKLPCSECITLAVCKGNTHIRCSILYDIIRNSLKEYPESLDSEEVSEMITEVFPHADKITTHSTGMPRLVFRGIQKGN